MDKYSQNLVKNVRNHLEKWLNEQSRIQANELYRFLHSIAGAATIIGFNKAGELAQSLMSQLKESDNREWTKEELQRFLSPLISIFNYEEYSYIDEVIEQKKSLKTKNSFY